MIYKLAVFADKHIAEYVHNGNHETIENEAVKIYNHFIPKHKELVIRVYFENCYGMYELAGCITSYGGGVYGSTDRDIES